MAGGCPERLEDPVAELEAAVERGQVERVGRLQSTVDPDVTAGKRGPAGVGRGHATSLAPTARSGPRAFATVSSHSAPGSLRHVIPPPTWRLNRSPSATNVRMRIDELIAPSGPSQPAMPVYGPRRTGSSASSSSIAR